MQTRRASNLKELQALAGDWNCLAAGVPFRSFAWLSTWWRHYQPAMVAAGRQVELYTLSVMDGEKLIGLAPWYIDRSRRAGHVVRFLGSGDVCSDYINLLCLPGRQTDVAQALADWLTQSSRDTGNTEDRWDILELANVDASEPMLGLLGDRLRVRGAAVHTSLAENTWRIDLPARADVYLELLSKSHRKQLRQIKRRFFDTGQAVLRTVQQPSDIDRGWEILTHLHQSRLTSLGKPGSFESATFREFHRDVTTALYQSGSLGLYWLEHEGRPIAAEYHLLGDEVVFAFQGGIDPEALKYEPGRLITFATLERAIDSGYRGYDFCRGDEPYKRHWRAQPRENVNWRMVSNRSSARLRHSVWIAGQNARNWVRLGLQKTGLKSP